jgi:hypothetical protein
VREPTSCALRRSTRPRCAARHERQPCHLRSASAESVVSCRSTASRAAARAPRCGGRSQRRSM